MQKIDATLSKRENYTKARWNCPRPRLGVQVYAIIPDMRTIAENANDFADLRTMGKGDCIYVDKTDYFHRLVTDGRRKLFFIARPRRFGKSLMITTFKYSFEGRRDLLLLVDAAWERE